MIRWLAVLALTLSLTAPALAADSLVKLTLDGRPVDRSSGSALLHDGVVYGDVVDLVRSFDGIITFAHGTVVVTINGVTGTFTIGSRTAKLGSASVDMPGLVFEHDGDVFVPLEVFITRVAAAKVRISPDRSRADIYVNSNPLS